MQLDINYYFNMQPSANDRYLFYCARETSFILLNFSRFTAKRACEGERFHFNPRQENFSAQNWSRNCFSRNSARGPFTFQSGSLDVRLTTETTPVQRWKLRRKIFSLDFTVLCEASSKREWETPELRNISMKLFEQIQPEDLRQRFLRLSHSLLLDFESFLCLG